jgi:hypothetical protein
MRLKLSSRLKSLGVEDGIFFGKIDEAEFSIEISKKDGEFPIIIKDGFIEIPDEVVSKVHLNGDKEFEVDVAPTDDYLKRYNKDRFAIVII